MVDAAVRVPVQEGRRMLLAARPSLKQWLFCDQARTGRGVPIRVRTRFGLWAQQHSPLGSQGMMRAVFVMASTWGSSWP